MKTERFKTIEEDGIVIFDESDDLVPGEAQILDEDDELDVEYLLRETARQEEQEAEEKRKHRWVSAGVIAVMVIFIAGVCYFNFRNIL